MGFIGDLKEGEAMEKAVSKVLTNYFGKEVQKNEDKTGVDLIIKDWNLLIEVKYDRMVQDTGNYVFEFKCNGKTSGIDRKYDTEEWGETHPHFLVQAHSNGFELYHNYKLLKWVEENNDRVVKGGDGWRSEMYLVKREKLSHLIIKEFDYEI